MIEAMLWTTVVRARDAVEHFGQAAIVDPIWDSLLLLHHR
jgi:hypothetical protein